MSLNFNRMKQLPPFVMLWLAACLAKAEPNEPSKVIVATEAQVQAKFDEYKPTAGNYPVLLEAQKLSNCLYPRNSQKALDKQDESALRLQLKILVALTRACDTNYNRNAESNRVYMNVMPPLAKKGGLYASGMSPEGIKDPEERKAYEDAIAANRKRGEKLNRETELSRGVDYAVITTWRFTRSLPTDSEARKRAFEIIESSISTPAVLKRLQSDASPGMTW